MAFMCVHQANKANLNPGVITAMWSITPLWMALTDYLVFGIRLKYHHFIGMFCMIICTLVLALSDLMKGTDLTKQQQVATWVPVLYALLFPWFCVSNSLIVKHLTLKRGFDAQDMSYSAYFIANTATILAGIYFWRNVIAFDSHIFFWGFIGSLFNTFGMVLIQVAYSRGPSGPVGALSTSAAVILVVVEAIKHQRFLSKYELTGLLFGVYGGFILVVPEFYEKYCFCCCIKRKKKSER